MPVSTTTRGFSRRDENVPADSSPEMAWSGCDRLLSRELLAQLVSKDVVLFQLLREVCDAPRLLAEQSGDHLDKLIDVVDLIREVHQLAVEQDVPRRDERRRANAAVTANVGYLAPHDQPASAGLSNRLRKPAIAAGRAHRRDESMTTKRQAPRDIHQARDDRRPVVLSEYVVPRVADPSRRPARAHG